MERFCWKGHVNPGKLEEYAATHNAMYETHPEMEELMRAAGLAVAMGNAIPAVRALADDVTDDCDHDGAAHAIEKYMPRARIADVG